MDLEVEVTSCSKDNGEKPCFKWTAFLIDYVSAYKSQMVFMGLDVEADERRIKA